MDSWVRHEAWRTSAEELDRRAARGAQVEEALAEQRAGRAGVLQRLLVRARSLAGGADAPAPGTVPARAAYHDARGRALQPVHDRTDGRARWEP